MRWLVGFDPPLTSRGVVHFGRWLHTRTEGRHVLHAVHVDTSAATGLNDDPGAGPHLEDSERRVQRFLEEERVADAFDRVEAVHGVPEKVLQALAQERDYDGLLLGRAARSDEFPLLALGRVPRRLLRWLELPTIVVPRDLGEQAFGCGPIVVGVTPSPESLEAVDFALLLGEELALPVVLVHVVPLARPLQVEGVLRLEPHDPTMAASDIAPPEDTAPHEVAIREWVAEHELDALELELRVGLVPVEVMKAARERTATMIVCGSRRLSLLERLFSSSVGSELAAQADRPVAVVPSGSAS
jgi:nucleotide-binding universal stress UspA family protein